MAITHFATAMLLSRAMRADQIPQFESAGNMAVRFARTFALQAETLAKLQRGGEQIVKVVHVHSGAQAVVGTVIHAPQPAFLWSGCRPPVGTQAGAAPNNLSSANGAIGGSSGEGATHENCNQPQAKAIQAADRAAELPPLWGQDEERQPVPVAVAGKARCRMHGGALGSGATAGARNGSYRQGQFTKDAIAERAGLSGTLRLMRATLREIERLTIWCFPDDAPANGLPGPNI